MGVFSFWGYVLIFPLYGPSKLAIADNNVTKVLIYPKKSKSMNLAFDVTPAKYVTGLITEKGVCEASTDGLKKLFKWATFQHT